MDLEAWKGPFLAVGCIYISKKTQRKPERCHKYFTHSNTLGRGIINDVIKSQ